MKPVWWKCQSKLSLRNVNNFSDIEKFKVITN